MRGYMPCSFCLCVRALAGAGDRPQGDCVLLGGGWEALCATLDCGRGGAGWRLLRGICDIVRLEWRATRLGDRGMPELDGVGKRPRGKECRAAPSLDNKAQGIWSKTAGWTCEGECRSNAKQIVKQAASSRALIQGSKHRTRTTPRLDSTRRRRCKPSSRSNRLGSSFLPLRLQPLPSHLLLRPDFSSEPSNPLRLPPNPIPSLSNPRPYLQPMQAAPASTSLDSSLLYPHPQLKYSLFITSPHLDLIYLLSTPCPSPRRKTLQELVDSHRTRLECAASHRSIKR
ncbi:hypothetical protein B0H14DRAFT_542460 [Mycena olivaceomarginata]|nr:hypothetical protein B0H14DRAFT_542460 [Mycena olivaceomarginata]